MNFLHEVFPKVKTHTCRDQHTDPAFSYSYTQLLDGLHTSESHTHSTITHTSAHTYTHILYTEYLVMIFVIQRSVFKEPKVNTNYTQIDSC